MSSYMNTRDAFSAYPYITTTSLRLKTNPTILTAASASNFDTYTKYNPNYDTMTLNDLAKFKSLSVKGLYDLGTYPYYTYLEGFETHLPSRTDHLFPSEFDTNSFRRYKMIRKPVQPIELDLNDRKMIEDQYYSKKSLANELDSNSICNSINNSMNNSIAHSVNMVEQNQMNDNVVLRQLATRPFDYLNRPGSVMNLAIPYESDENFNNIVNENKDAFKKSSDQTKSVHSLRDVAL